MSAIHSLVSSLLGTFFAHEKAMQQAKDSLPPGLYPVKRGDNHAVDIDANRNVTIRPLTYTDELPKS